MLILLEILISFIFGKSLTVFFVQDDFWLLSVSRGQTFLEVLNLFKPSSEAVWYRPLSSQVFFYLGQFFFGLNPGPYHVLVLLTHLITVYILYKLVKQLWQNETISLLAAFFYGTHQIHTVSLSWLAAYLFVLGPLFLVFWLKYLFEKKYHLAFWIYVLGIFTTEVFVVIPLVITLYQIISDRKLRGGILFPYWLVAFGIIWLRYIAFPTQQISSLYNFALTVELAGLARFYLLRLLGVPLFFEALTWPAKLISGGLVLGFGLSLVLGLWHLKKISASSRPQFYILSLLSFGTLLPFVLLPQHIAPHYLAFSLVGIAPLFAWCIWQGQQLLPKIYQQIFIVVVVAVFLVNQIIGNQWTYQTHWLFSRAKLAKHLVEIHDLEQPVGSEEYYALGANAAAQIYQNAR
ncbi:MAG: putative membrane protein [Candidatus Gottesmanbacteria bacterium GW2011_GWB1_43_11]|uniref:Putative membrane protein n=1 Tax=Candidatus Gottesmanbacteria bacterium GW2011_GWB1_43_11 TaxID=1618446 RepID=A0A0G1CPK4_9BACT|nr:MAG: putative membrane protein [Candidatus Gottesmanbacteria bacterium GW2011_GWA2_42_16]KKS56277.1 MAG: putative membrane protein [Candidatus Gottesmanbacteria bacterium GW2011_GWA1_42_26]KKS82285.1 MAG: putative membrane protein [Candidatus Gottesmanbacteria bacterium GW2011_GWC1_43_10]KKS87479.1 MAG: putative membrane protein [Candidatus Gottesmanbacteria bacterium GW2011_GWB1_43_11]OGG10146.1 MAG: hypothetical protein A2699_01205 [Candidatus Gottesmanbacteria bacterium RIFCSPHIGHO2_01_FU